MPASFLRIEIDGQNLNDFSPDIVLKETIIRQELNLVDLVVHNILGA